MLGEFNESFLPLGNLHIHLLHAGSFNNYTRELNLENGIVKVGYDCGAYHYEREYFASYPAKAIFFRLQAEAPILHMEISMDSLLDYHCTAKKNGLEFWGRCPEHIDPSYMPLRPESVVWGNKGMTIHAKVEILSCDGEVSIQGDRLIIDSVKECALMISAVKEPILPQKFDYKTIRELHVRDYRSIYNKVELYLGEQMHMPTDERLRLLKEGKEDNGLYALYFQYGRYLLISSSREGSLPPNLQGIWSWDLRAPWSGNYTVNINTQMNYWLAQNCNMEECMEPYFRFMERICEEGKRTANLHYGCRGFVLHHNIDYWGNTNPVGLLPEQIESSEEFVQSAFWPMGGAWLTLELFKAYEYSLDKEYLKKTAWPITKEAVLFLADWLVEYDGKYITCPSISPENSYIDKNGNRVRTTMGSAMDMSIIAEVFDNYIWDPGNTIYDLLCCPVHTLQSGSRVLLL